MIFEEALREHLLADAAIASLVGTRVFPGVAPQAAKLPLIRFIMVAKVSEESHRGASGLARRLMQVDSFSGSYDQAKSLAELVRLRLQGFAGRMGGVAPDGVAVQAVHFDGERDLYDDDLELHGVSTDYRVWHEEAVPGE